MNSGRLRQIVQIQKKERTDSSPSGSPVPVWSVFRDKVPAGIRDSATVDDQREHQIKATCTHIVATATARWYGRALRTAKRPCTAASRLGSSESNWVCTPSAAASARREGSRSATVRR